LVAPYDAELFGHWWYEGPMFLKEVIKQVCENESVDMTFLSEDLDRRKPQKVVSIPEGSWGQGNHHYIWLNQQTEWTWKHIYESEAKMCQLAARWENETKLNNDNDLTDILKQMARELMLMSSSDWQFLISTFAARDYAELRLSEHYEDFKKLTIIAEKKIANKSISDGEWQFFRDCQTRDTIFQELELEWFAKVEYPV